MMTIPNDVSCFVLSDNLKAVMKSVSSLYSISDPLEPDILLEISPGTFLVSMESSDKLLNTVFILPADIRSETDGNGNVSIVVPPGKFADEMDMMISENERLAGKATEENLVILSSVSGAIGLSIDSGVFGINGKKVSEIVSFPEVPEPKASMVMRVIESAWIMLETRHCRPVSDYFFLRLTPWGVWLTMMFREFVFKVLCCNSAIQKECNEVFPIRKEFLGIIYRSLSSIFPRDIVYISYDDKHLFLRMRQKRKKFKKDVVLAIPRL